MASFPSEINLEQLFRKYYTRLVYFAFQMVGDKESAEDIVQDVFIKYWAQQEKAGLEESSIKGYLFNSVKNACLNIRRHHKVLERYKNQVELSQQEEETIIHAIIRSEVLTALHAAIETLPSSCQKIARLSFLEEKKNHEIAEELGISINTVKTQKQRGLQLLRLQLNPEVYSALLFLIIGR